MKYLKKYYVTLFLSILGLSSFAQPVHKSSKAQFIGISNDTVFYAGTQECFIYFIGGKNEFEIVFPALSIKSDRPRIDSIFHHLEAPQIKITGKVIDGVFTLNRTENSEKDQIMDGSLWINNQVLQLSQSYRVYGNSSGLPSQRKLYLDLRFYFDPAYFGMDEQNLMSNPVEFIIQGGYVNQKN